MDEFVKGKEVIVFSLDQIPPFDKAVSTMSKELGIPLFDAHDLILNGMRNSGDEHWYIPIPPGDHHYSEAGHKEIAIWLHKKLGTILE